MASNAADKVEVSSVLYNLAGPEDRRPQFLKSVILGCIQRNIDITEGVTAALLSSPAVKLKNFFGWAAGDTEFQDKFGITSGKLKAITSVDNAVLMAEVPPPSGCAVDSIEQAEIHKGRIHFWVLQWMYLNHPSDPIPQPTTVAPADAEPYTYSYNSGTNLVSVTFPSAVVYTFTPTGYDPDADFLYVKYRPVTLGEELSYTPGSFVFLAPGDPDPSFPLETWARIERTRGIFEATVTATDTSTRAYSDPSIATVIEEHPPVTADVSEPTLYEHWVSDVAIGTDISGSQAATRTHKEYWVEWEVDTDTEEVTRTLDLGGSYRYDSVLREFEYLKKIRKTRTSTQTIRIGTVLPAQWYIYKYGSGNSTLDAQMVDEITAELGEIFPPIPLRIDNQAVTSKQASAEYWRIQVEDPLDFAWSITSLGSGVDVQVATRETGPFASVYPVSAVGGGVYDVLAWSPADHPTIGEDAVYPAYRALTETTAENFGFYRIRNLVLGEWVADPVQPLLARPEALSTGLDPLFESDYYPVAAKAFKKAFGSDYDDMLALVQANNQIKDIDYAYVTCGVPLNVQDNAGKKYLYQFFLHLMSEGGTGEASTFKSAYMRAYLSEQNYLLWYASTRAEDGTASPIQESTNPDGRPPNSRVAPTRTQFPPVDWKVVDIASENSALNFHMKIRWAFVQERTGHSTLTRPEAYGVAAGPAAAGELFWKVEDDFLPLDPEIIGERANDYEWLKNAVSLNWQVTATRWKKLIIVGLTHENLIYQGHSVLKTARESINWTERHYVYNEETEEYDLVISDDYQESPFFVPLHKGTYDEIGLVNAAQLSTCCAYIMFNCYSIVETPWWASDWFQVVLIVLSVILVLGAIVTAAFTGGASVAGAGALIVSALGTGVLSGILGALANILVGFALSWAIGEIARMLLGDQVGSVVGAILSLALGGFAAGGFNPEQITSLFTTAPGLISVATATGSAVGQELQKQAERTAEEGREIVRKVNAETADLLKKLQDLKPDVNLLYASKFLDQMAEKPDMFLNRTLLTGSDIARGVLEQIENFTKDRLALKY